ncbi:phosphatase PAP2 family protein [Candidatus Woesearchaeota archaeon]|nr:phosphatase PAP2 family protein [Candidatus Woesearchaeota archaeon]
MKKNEILMLIIALALFLISYNLDEKVNLLFKNAKFAFLDVILGIITNFGIVVVIMAAMPSIMLYKKNKKAVYLIWSAFVVSVILAFIIKLIALRQRPTEAFAYPFVNIINYSFPSMHAMAVFSLLPILIKYIPKQRHFWAWFAFLVALSRIYFGFHFLSDVVFGAFAGYFIGTYLLELHNKGKLWKK